MSAVPLTSVSVEPTNEAGTVKPMKRGRAAPLRRRARRGRTA